MSDQEFKPLDGDFVFEGTSKEYVLAPVKKLLKFHVVQPETTEQINNFKTNPDGTENADFGKPQPVLIFKAMLDSDVPGKGQVYSRWITGYYKDGKPVYSLGDRSTLGKIADAICGSVDEFKKTRAADLIGLPFQCALKPGSKNPDRLLLDTDKIMPAAEDQTKATADVVLADIPTEDDPLGINNIPF
jgi:hypothetical protein